MIFGKTSKLKVLGFRKLWLSKKASDWLPALVSVVLAAFLLTIVALMIFKVAGDLEINKFEPRTSKLSYDLVAARILNSPTCLAWQERYVGSDSQVKDQTHAGVIDHGKLQSVNLPYCLGNLEYEVMLEDLDGDWDIGNTRYEYREALSQEDKFFVNIHMAGYPELHRGLLTVRLK